MKKWSGKFTVIKYIVIISFLQLMFINCGGEFESNQLSSSLNLNSNNVSEQNGSAPSLDNEEAPATGAANEVPASPVTPAEEVQQPIVGAPAIPINPVVEPSQPVVENPVAPALPVAEEVKPAVPAPVESKDPRTKLLNSPHRIGFGAKTTGGTNYVYVKSFAELRAALQKDGNYVLLDSSLAGKEIIFTQTVYPANNITLDGSLAPGHSLVASPNLPRYHTMFNNTGVGGQGNKIFHSIKLVGNYSQHRIEHGAIMVFKGDNYWLDHVEVTDFLDDAIGMGFSQQGSADYITVSNCKLHKTGKALYAWYQDKINHGQGHITAFYNELAAAERNPNNRGAEHFHFFNNWVHDWRWEAAVSGGKGATGFPELAGNRTIDSNMLSQSNVYEKANSNESQCAETADPAVGLAYGGWLYIDGKSIYNGLTTCYSWGSANRVSEDSNQGPGKPVIPYSYNLLPADQVKAYVQQNAGPLR